MLYHFWIIITNNYIRVNQAKFYNLVLLASGRNYFGCHLEWRHVGVTSVCLIIFQLVNNIHVILVQDINVDNGLTILLLFYLHRG